MTKLSGINGMKGIGMSVYELTPMRYYGESFWILAHDFEEATTKATRIVSKMKDRIGSLELQGTIDA